MDHSRHFPKIIAHRGFCKQYIENTIPALTAAVAVKAEMVEMDVHETRDGHFIVHHDNALNRDTPPFRNLTYGQSQRLAGNDGRAPMLSDCLEAIGSMPVDLEIKSCINVANLARELEKLSPSPGSVVSSFDFSLLKQLNAQKIKQPLLLLVTISTRQALMRNIRSIAICIAPRLLPGFLDGVAVDYRLAHKMFIRNVQRNGSKVLIWTVNNRKQMEKFISRGVDGIITDYPDLLLKLLNPLPNI
jgi:glycerophosphoryl diester phosphodiesterase